MKAGAATVVLGFAFLSGCQTYTPTLAPVRLEAYSALVGSRRLEETPASAVWSGADLLSAALVRNARVAEAAAKYRTAMAAVKAAAARAPTTLTLSTEYSNEPSPWLFGAGLGIPLDSGARRSERITQGDLAALQARYGYGEAVWAVRSALQRARAERLCADAEIDIAETLVLARQNRADRLDRRVAAGEDDDPTALVAHTELAAARQRLDDARARREQADIALAKALGVSANAVRDLKLAPLGSGPSSPFNAALRENAVLSRSDILSAVADYDLAESALRTEVLRQRPEVQLGPGYSWDHGVSKLPFNLSLTLPPADMNRAAIAGAEVKRAEAGRTLEALQADILAQVDQSAAALAAARSSLTRAQSRDLAVARRLENAAARSVGAGESARTDELAARAARIEAELVVADADRTTAFAVIDLEDALRMPFDPAEAAVLQAALSSQGERR